MQEANTLVQKVILPWLQKHHPHADVVIMAGSYGRAMKQGSYQPLTSSDVDLVILYSDLEKGGFSCAVQSFSQEEVGTALGEDKPRIMMIDTNVLDLAGLHYHDKIVRDVAPYAFINVMLDEGHVLIDRLGIGAVLQEKAARFLAEGPRPTPAPQFQAEIDDIRAYMVAIGDADCATDRQMLGALALYPFCEYVLGVHDYWRSGSNQAYRRLVSEFPEDAAEMTRCFARLIREGDAGDALNFMQKMIKRGEATLPARPPEAVTPAWPVEKHVDADICRQRGDMFQKFMTEHLCEALETSKKRGELAYLENMSSTLNFIVRNLCSRDGDAAPAAGIETLYFLNTKLPDLMPNVLTALEGQSTAPIAAAAEQSLSHLGGMHYQQLRNVYIDDLARVNATKPGAKASRHFNPGFTPKR